MSLLVVEHKAAIQLEFDDSFGNPRAGVLWKDPRIFLTTKARRGARAIACVQNDNDLSRDAFQRQSGLARLAVM